MKIFLMLALISLVGGFFAAAVAWGIFWMIGVFKPPLAVREFLRPDPERKMHEFLVEAAETMKMSDVSIISSSTTTFTGIEFKTPRPELPAISYVYGQPPNIFTGPANRGFFTPTKRKYLHGGTAA